MKSKRQSRRRRSDRNQNTPLHLHLQLHPMSSPSLIHSAHAIAPSLLALHDAKFVFDFCGGMCVARCIATREYNWLEASNV